MRKIQENSMYVIKKVWVKSLGLMIALLLIVSSSVHAIWLGQSQVNPYVEIQGNYDSNIYRASDQGDIESDFIIVLSPGIHVEFPTTKESSYRFLANYRANLNFYTKNGDATIDPDSQLNTTEHRLDAQARLNFASGLNLSTGYILNLGSVPPDFIGDTRDKYTEHEIQAQAGYKFVDRYEVQLGYDGTFRKYKEENIKIDDITTHRLDATFFYRLFPSLSLLGGGGYAKIDRQEPAYSDSTEYRGFGGFRYEATERLTGILKAGVVSKKFANTAFGDTTNAYVSGELVANFSENTKASVRLNRDLAETSVTEDSAENGAYYVITGVRATLNHTFATAPNLSLAGLVSYQKKTYPEDLNDRSDNALEVGVGAEYKFYKFIIVGVKYAHSGNDSNIDANDFSDNLVTLSIRAIL